MQERQTTLEARSGLSARRRLRTGDLVRLTKRMGEYRTSPPPPPPPPPPRLVNVVPAAKWRRIPFQMTRSGKEADALAEPSGREPAAEGNAERDGGSQGQARTPERRSVGELRAFGGFARMSENNESRLAIGKQPCGGQRFLRARSNWVFE